MGLLRAVLIELGVSVVRHSRGRIIAQRPPCGISLADEVDHELYIRTVGVLLQEGFALANHFTELIRALGAAAARIPARSQAEEQTPALPTRFLGKVSRRAREDRAGNKIHHPILSRQS